MGSDLKLAIHPLPLGGTQGCTRHKYCPDVDDDNVGSTALTDVTITVDNNAAIAFIEEDEGNHLW